MEELPLPKVYQSIEPGPVSLLTTAAKGRFNVMTMSWHMMVDFIPPLVACIVRLPTTALPRCALQGMRHCHSRPEARIEGRSGR